MAKIIKDDTYTSDKASFIKKKNELNNLIGQLDLDRASFIPTWRDVAEHVCPTRARFFMETNNRGDRRNKKIIDASATFASKTLAAGMMSGMTSASRPWFRYTTPDPDLADYQPVKIWLNTVEQRTRAIFLKSNLYNTLPLCYRDTGNFGTGPISLEEDFNNVIHTHSFPVGSYYLGKDYLGRINTFAREFRMTVGQIIEKFCPRDGGKVDLSKVSDHIAQEYKAGRTETWIYIRHLIRPNPDYNPNRIESKFKKFSSCYWEMGMTSRGTQNYLNSGTDIEKFLSEKGYDYFPIMAPRWEVTGEDVYGTDCPGISATGDIKQLQYGEKKTGQVIDHKVNPAMIAHPNLRSEKLAQLPGTVTYLDDPSGRGFRPAYEVNLSIQEMEAKQAQVRQRISRHYHEDLFLQISRMSQSNTTAREIDERHEEKYLILGPVIQQFDQDLLGPLIDNTFYIADRQGIFPPAPKELQGQNLKVEYISIMAQAQKALGISSIERFVGFIGNVAQLDPGVVQKLNTDQFVDEYADSLGVSPRLVKSDDEVAEIRNQQAQAQQAQAAIMNAKEASVAAKNLSETDVDKESALKKMLGV